jgi:hypothetical protein
LEDCGERDAIVILRGEILKGNRLAIARLQARESEGGENFRGFGGDVRGNGRRQARLNVCLGPVARPGDPEENAQEQGSRPAVRVEAAASDNG